MQAGYFSTAWADIKSTEGWFGKVCLLGLLQLIPIFGQIVLLGYAFGWAREIAWNVHKPLPARIFANEDGKLYRRGWFLVVVAFVLALIPLAFLLVSDAFSVSASVGTVGYYARGINPGAGAAAVFSFLFYLLYLVASFAAMFFTWVGSMRSAIYDNIGSGLQLGKIWKMMRRDGGGIARIFGMNLIFGFIFGIIVGIVCVIVFVVAFASVLPQIAAMGDSYYYNSYAYSYGYDGLSSNSYAALLSSLVPMLGGLIIFLVVLIYVTFVFESFMEVLTARALGYWTRQFDVAKWGSQNDPMPFETQPAQQPYQTYQQPYQAPQQQAQPTQAQPVQQAPAVQPTQPAAPVAQQEPPAAPTTPVVAAVPVSAPAPEPTVAPAPAQPVQEAQPEQSAQPVQEEAPVQPEQSVQEEAPAQVEDKPAEDNSGEGTAPLA